MRVIHGELNVVTDSIWGDFTDGQRPKVLCTSGHNFKKVTLFCHHFHPWRHGHDNPLANSPCPLKSQQWRWNHGFLPWNIAGSYPLGNNGGILKLLGIQWEYHSILILVGDLEHEFYDVPFSWEFHSPNWRTHNFQRGGYTTNQNQIRSLIC